VEEICPVEVGVVMRRNDLLLEVRGLTKKFGGLKAVDDVSLDLECGEILGIIGPNGAGKSTLFSLLSGDAVPSEGRMFFKGEEITRVPNYLLARKGIARTFQTNRVFTNETVLDNIFIGLLPEIGHGVWNALVGRLRNRMQRGQLIDRCNEVLGFVDLAGKADATAGELDQEEQKRLAIGIAIVKKPSLLLLDEPTGGVNVEEIDHLIRIIRKIWEGGTTICLIEHKMKMVMELCRKIVVLNYGRKIAEGTPEEIRCNDAAIKAYLGDENAT